MKKTNKESKQLKHMAGRWYKRRELKTTCKEKEDLGLIGSGGDNLMIKGMNLPFFKQSGSAHNHEK
jgi:hypothetical protein